MNGKPLIPQCFNMKVEIKDNPKLITILEKREAIHKEIGYCMEQLMKIDKDKTKLGYKMEKLKEKTKVIMDDLAPELGEFEIIVRVFEEGGKAYYEVIDQVEEYKIFLREKGE